jgi:biopolymer transport protein ExbD
MITTRKKRKLKKLNLIPILDAIFIFIFFLLISSQFIDIHELGTDAPSILLVKDQQKKEPLNLTLDIKKKKILVKTGLDGKIYRSIAMKGSSYNYSELNKALIEIKRNNIDESSIILRPSANIAYDHIIQIMDTVRNIKSDQQVISGKSNKGTNLSTRKLFEQIIFETVM